MFSASLFSQNKEVNTFLKQDSVLFNNTMGKALSFFKEKQLDSFKKYSKLSALFTKQPKGLQEIHFYLATYYKYTEKPDSAYYHYNQSKNLLLEIGDSITAGKRWYNIGLLSLNENNILASETAYISALKSLEKTNYYIIKYYIYNNLGLIAKERKELQEALKYFDLSLQELKKDSITNHHLQINTINNKGLLYQHFNQHKKAIPYFKKGLAIDSIKEKYPTQYALLLENLAASNYLLGNKENVLQQYIEVLEIRNKSKDFKELSTTHINISDYYKDLNQVKKALFYSTEALKYAKQTHNNKRWLEALKKISELTKGEESKQYLREYITLNDSLFQKERQLKNQFAKIRYETDKKEKENAVLKTENQQKQAEITYQKQHVITRSSLSEVEMTTK